MMPHPERAVDELLEEQMVLKFSNQSLNNGGNHMSLNA